MKNLTRLKEEQVLEKTILDTGAQLLKMRDEKDEETSFYIDSYGTAYVNDSPLSGGGSVNAYTKLESDNKFATKEEIPTTLPNPQSLTINGTSYTGSQAVSIDIATEQTSISINNVVYEPVDNVVTLPTVDMVVTAEDGTTTTYKVVANV